APCRSVLAVALVLVACRSKPKAEPVAGGASERPRAATVPSGAPDDTSASGAGAGLSARFARCGWGLVKAEPGAEAPPFAIAVVDIVAPAAIRGLRVTAFELGTDADVVAKMSNRATVRVQEGASSYSFGAANPRELEALLPAGSYRVRVSAALDRSK